MGETLPVNYKEFDFKRTTFCVYNLETLQELWLTLSDIKKTQIWIEMNEKINNCVLVEYQITEWLVDELPLLYVSQLFIPRGNDMILMSFITENQSSHLSALNMFKNIR